MGANAIVVGVGASAGVGGALCRRFAREGLHVFAAGRTVEKLEALAQEIEGLGGTLTPVVTDATSEADVIRLFDTAEAAAGPPTIVVYNAGNNQFRPLLEMTAEFWEGVWRLCCFGGFLVAREAARRMVPAGGGTLLFTGATASIRARPPFTAFASAKAALRALAHGMAREFGPQGIHVGHVIVDGGIDGDQLNSRFPQFKESRGDDGMLNPDSIADAFWALHRQEKTAWTLELDVRPYKEQF
ncbi:MAG: SDR family NAD(P)-dependent oxidoreductase [Proteobacteria bacterium]|nr:SDR family NAD(P)-dependent oxidoreductase [Pseudomonadota bacterium]